METKKEVPSDKPEQQTPYTPQDNPPVKIPNPDIPRDDNFEDESERNKGNEAE